MIGLSVLNIPPVIRRAGYVLLMVDNYRTGSEIVEQVDWSIVKAAVVAVDPDEIFIRL